MMKLRITSSSHAAFAAILVLVGVVGLAQGDLTTVWDGVPSTWLIRDSLGYLCALVSIACGIGLVWQRSATLAARLLFGFFVLWMLVFKLRFIVIAPLNEIVYQTNGVTAVYVAAAWVLYTRLAGDWDRQHLAYVAGEKGVHIAQLLYGLALIGFGFSHYAFLKNTYTLVPDWLPWHVGWAYFTGATYLAGAVGILSGVCPRLATTLAALQIAGFTLLVWPPLALSGTITSFQWGEFLASGTLTAASWVMADSYAGMPWLAVRGRE